jgi:Cof subfamily protein (haloacid dehalogenase superfamily)
MFRMIAIDIDDTLITDDNIVTEGTKEALRKAQAQNVIVTLATGRMFASAKQIARQIDLNVPIITYQGALIKTLIDEKTLYEKTVPQRTAAFLFNYAARHGLHLQGYYEDRLYAKEENDKLIGYSRLSNVPYIIEPEFERLASLPMTKLLIIDEPEKLDQIAAELKPKIGEEVHITKSKPHYLEFMHKEGTKGQALRFLAGHFGCSMEEVIAIGDSWNDHDMLEAAGLGVAMANAVDSLKQIADYVTLSNNEEGVRHVIEKFILSQEGQTTP